MARIEVNTKEETTESLKALSSYFASLCGAVELEDTPAPEDTPDTVEATVNVPAGEVEEDLGNDETRASAGHAAGAADAASDRLDLNGVAFDPKFCAESKDPFYNTGKKTGQWKKRRGVSEEGYAAWYDGELNAEDNADFVRTAAHNEGKDIDVGQAFGAKTAVTAAQAKQFETVGEFMAWTSEKVAAELLNQDAIGAAYSQLNIDPMALFQLSGEAQLETVHSLYDILAQTAGA